MSTESSSSLGFKNIRICPRMDFFHVFLAFSVPQIKLWARKCIIGDQKLEALGDCTHIIWSSFLQLSMQCIIVDAVYTTTVEDEQQLATIYGMTTITTWISPAVLHKLVRVPFLYHVILCIMLCCAKVLSSVWTKEFVRYDVKMNLIL